MRHIPVTLAVNHRCHAERHHLCTSPAKIAPRYLSLDSSGLWRTQSTAAAVVTVVLLVGSAQVPIFVTAQKTRTDRQVAMTKADADAGQAHDAEAKPTSVRALTKRIESSSSRGWPPGSRSDPRYDR